MSELVRLDPAGPPVVYEPPPQKIWIDQYLDDKDSEITRYLQIVLKRRWLVVSVTVLALAVTAAWTATMPRFYTSSVNLQIDPEQSVLPYKEMYDSVTADPRYLGTQAQVLKS